MRTWFRIAIRHLASLLAVGGMVWIATALDNHEIVFPEVAALAVGFWLIPKRVWWVTRGEALAIMVLASFLGTLLALYSPLPALANIAVGFSLVYLLLALARSTFYPAVSACLLPLVLGVGGWVYPIAVACLVGLILSLQWLFEQLRLRPRIPLHNPVPPLGKRLLPGCLMLAAVVGISALPLYFGQRYFVLPPLIVAFAELANPNSGLRKAPLRILIIIALCALVGSTGQYLQHLWAIPAGGMTILILASVLGIFTLANRRFAPAAALAIVPQIFAEPVSIPLYTSEVASGAIVFIALAFVLFPKPKVTPR